MQKNSTNKMEITVKLMFNFGFEFMRVCNSANTPV
ncbi:MAG: hypothetical protein PWQ54_1090 [Bacteroidales bacterium]|jgi:hypothetical protein|nr:hypothetical protein [Bacteroidales bacterium]